MLTTRSVPPTPTAAMTPPNTPMHTLSSVVPRRTFLQQRYRQLRRSYRRFTTNVRYCCNTASWLTTITIALCTVTLLVIFYMQELRPAIGFNSNSHSTTDLSYNRPIRRPQSLNNPNILQHLQQNYQLVGENTLQVSKGDEEVECSNDHSVYEHISQTIPPEWLVVLYSPCEQAILQSPLRDTLRNYNTETNDTYLTTHPIYLNTPPNTKQHSSASALISAITLYYKTLISTSKYIAVLSVPTVNNNTTFQFLHTYSPILQKQTSYINFELDIHVCAQLTDLQSNDDATLSQVWDHLQLPKDTVKPDVLCNGASWNYAFRSNNLLQYQQTVWNRLHKTLNNEQMDAMTLILPHLLGQPSKSNVDLYNMPTDLLQEDSLQRQQITDVLLNDTIPHSHSLRAVQYSRHNDYLNWQHESTIVTLDYPGQDLSWMTELPYSMALYVYGIEMQGRLLTSTTTMPLWSDVHYLNGRYEEQHYVNISSKHFALTYLHFIISHYDALPPTMIFMHPTRYINSTDTNTTRDKAQLLKRLKYNQPGNDYIPLGIDDHICQRTADLSSNITMLQYDQLWNHVLMSNWYGTYPSLLCYQPGGEFVVSRAAVLRNRKSVYEQLYEEILRVAVPTPTEEVTLTGFDHGLDPFYHVIFRQPSVTGWRSPAHSIYSEEEFRWVGADRITPQEWQASTPQYNDSEVEMPQHHVRQARSMSNHLQQYALNRAMDAPAAEAIPDMILPWSGVGFGKHGNLTAAVVVAAYKEDLSWLERYLPGVPHLAYVQGDPDVALQSHGHCNEASSYLTYIAQYYDYLPDLSVFVHGHQESWHNADIAATLKQFNWDWLYENGYHSLNCMQPYTIAPEGINNREIYPHFRQIHKYWNDISRGRLGETAPELFTNYCCSQFVVDKESVHRHPRQYYVDLYKYCRETTVDKYWTGRVFEFTFPLIFGKPAVVQDDPQLCCKISDFACNNK